MNQRRFSILLIEDNPADAGLVREALEAHEVEGDLILLGDGEKAIRFIQALDSESVNCPDLVILDLNLPKRSGHEVLQSIGRHEKCRDTKIVILSSSDAQQDRAAAFGLGADGYFRKPLRLEEFLDLGAVFKAMLEDCQR